MCRTMTLDADKCRSVRAQCSVLAQSLYCGAACCRVIPRRTSKRRANMPRSWAAPRPGLKEVRLARPTTPAGVDPRQEPLVPPLFVSPSAERRWRNRRFHRADRRDRDNAAAPEPAGTSRTLCSSGTGLRESRLARNSMPALIVGGASGETSIRAALCSGWSRLGRGNPWTVSVLHAQTGGWRAA